MINVWINDDGTMNDIEKRQFLRELGHSMNIEGKSIESLERYYKTFQNDFFRAYNALEKRRLERKKDVQMEERRDFEHRQASLRAPDEPSLAVVVTEYQSLDDIDIEFLCDDMTLAGVRKRAATQIRDDRRRVLAMAENRARKLASADAEQPNPASPEPQATVREPAVEHVEHVAAEALPRTAPEELGSFGSEAQSPYGTKTYFERRATALACLSPGVRQMLEEDLAEFDRELAAG